MSTEKEINLELAYNSLQRKEMEQRKVIKKQYLEIQELKKQLNLHRVSKEERSVTPVCPECGNPYPHLYESGSYSCEECGRHW